MAIAGPTDGDAEPRIIDVDVVAGRVNRIEPDGPADDEGDRLGFQFPRVT